MLIPKYQMQNSRNENPEYINTTEARDYSDLSSTNKKSQETHAFFAEKCANLPKRL